MHPLNSSNTRTLTMVRPRCSLPPHHPANVLSDGDPPLLSVLSRIPLINHLFNDLLALLFTYHSTPSAIEREAIWQRLQAYSNRQAIAELSMCLPRAHFARHYLEKIPIRRSARKCAVSARLDPLAFCLFLVCYLGSVLVSSQELTLKSRVARFMRLRWHICNLTERFTGAHLRHRQSVSRNVEA